MRKLACIAVILLIVIGLTPWATPARAEAGQCAKPKGTEVHIRQGAVPVVLVHGWRGNPEDMKHIAGDLNRRFGPQVAVFTFDYSEASTHWAGRPEIASCLAEYIRRVAHGFAQKVTVIAHSMGGLAVRFATSEKFAANPVTAGQLARLVTIDTPHLGSPFGGSLAADTMVVLESMVKLKGFPGANSDAANCLAPHHGDLQNLKPGCPLAPYLPKGVGVTLVSGENKLRRTLFGVEMYTYNLFTDGIVGSNSMAGYPGSAGTAPVGYKLAYRDVVCTNTSERSIGLLTAAVKQRTVHTAVLAAWVKFIADLGKDGAIMDGQNSDRPALITLSAWLGTYLASDCSHARILKHPDTFRVAWEAVNSALAEGGRLTMDALSSATVPSMCDHKSGRLKNGELKGDRSNNGGVYLDREMTRFGPTVPGRPDGAVAIFHCSQGGIGWPDYALFFDHRGGLLGVFDTGTVGASNGRQVVSNVAIQRNRVEVTVDAVPLSGDNELWGSSVARAAFQWDPPRARIVRSALTISTPDPMGRAFVNALQRRDRAAAQHLASRMIVKLAWPGTGIVVRFDRCIGPYSSGRVFSNVDAGTLLDVTQRGCLIRHVGSDGRSAVSMAVMKRSGFIWKVVDFIGIAS